MSAMPDLDLRLPDVHATETLGAALAASLPPLPAPMVVHCYGDLGAGKTTAVRAFLRALGVGGPVRSPTYTLIETYHPANLTVVHLDLYRLGSAEAVEELGLRDLARAETVFLIEWPQQGGRAVPAADVELHLHHVDPGREARLQARSALGQAWLENLVTDTRLLPYLSNLT